LRSIETIKECGVDESSQDREAPRPGADEIVVAMQAVGVEAIDAVVVAGSPR
jgi:NADPH:quinone reductase-like Zn-dependent oxidoreductase